MTLQLRNWLFSLALCVTGTSVMAQSVDILVENDSITWTGVSTSGNAGHDLKLSGPDGFSLQRTFKAGEAVQLGLDQLPRDGFFKSEIVVKPIVAEATIIAAREGDALAKSALPSGQILSVAFRLTDGNIPEGEETLEQIGPAPALQVIAQDLVVQGSICGGMDCTESEDFGYETLRLKENNLRIHFDDTSTGDFPANDWNLLANDAGSGGANYFAIVDRTYGTFPFKVEAGVPNHALYVAADGNVGLGTSSPVVELHVVDGDSPALRLEQDGSSGFGAYTWDLAANETNFFLRDVSGGDKLVLKAFPGTSVNNLVLRNERVGINVLDPQQSLHIANSLSPLILLDSNGIEVPDWVVGNDGVAKRFVISNTALPDAEFSLDASGNLTIAGLLVQNSDRDAKHRLTELSPAEVLDQVTHMKINRWQYKTLAGDHIGPMAQDFYQAFGLGQDETKIAILDVAGVALVAIQGLSEEIAQRDSTINELEAKVAQLESSSHQQQQLVSLIERYEARLAAVEQQVSESPRMPTNQQVSVAPASATPVQGGR